ncbi:MAG: TIGR04282 family arsenosugar biosynthesis glycosyltransferase [Acidocella sp.]|nr:TIGR04282 family arsenosugar biosynthesis glycosyltransferase [Acidocella sp.]
MPDGLTAETAALAFAVMAKAPQLGLVKTRLTPTLSNVQARVLSEAFLADSIGVVREACHAIAIDPYIAYMPAGAEMQLRDIAGSSIGLVLADGLPVDDVGVRGIGRSLLHATRHLLAAGHVGICLISADSPTLPVCVLREAAEHLARPGDRLVLGPSEDGGYYLIGLKAAHAELFREINWSTATVAAETVAQAAAIDLECIMLARWYDVDDTTSLQRLVTALVSGTETAPRTAAALRSFGLVD